MINLMDYDFLFLCVTLCLLCVLCVTSAEICGKFLSPEWQPTHEASAEANLFASAEQEGERQSQSDKSEFKTIGKQ
jgi:hypothetical protein